MQLVDLAYEELGNPSAEPVLILHGFFASSRNWRKIAESLALTYRVFSVDLRNHGNSPHHPEMDYPSMAEDVLAFMAKHSLVKAHILGHSMGGKCAMWLALQHPGRIDKLIIVDIAPKSYQHSFDNTLQAMMELPLSDIKNRKQAETWLSSAIPELEYRQFLLQNLSLREGAYGWRIDLAIFKVRAPNIVAFPEINSSARYEGDVLFIAGEDSRYVEKDDISTLFPYADFDTIPGAGHWVHAQQPERFIESVEKFLQRR